MLAVLHEQPSLKLVLNVMFSRSASLESDDVHRTPGVVNIVFQDKHIIQAIRTSLC